jgi:hypothetical protein
MPGIRKRDRLIFGSQNFLERFELCFSQIRNIRAFFMGNKQYGYNAFFILRRLKLNAYNVRAEFAARFPENIRYRKDPHVLTAEIMWYFALGDIVVMGKVFLLFNLVRT